MEAAVAGEEERVALRRRAGQGVERSGERALDRTDPEEARESFERPGDRQAAQQPVDRADLERVAGRVDEEDEAEVPGARRGLFPLEPEVGGPAVVAVGDQRLVPGQVRLDLGALGGVRDGPEAVVEPVLRRGGEQRGRSAVRSMTAAAPSSAPSLR